MTSELWGGAKGKFFRTAQRDELLKLCAISEIEGTKIIVEGIKMDESILGLLKLGQKSCREDWYVCTFIAIEL